MKEIFSSKQESNTKRNAKKLIGAGAIAFATVAGTAGCNEGGFSEDVLYNESCAVHEFAPGVGEDADARRSGESTTIEDIEQILFEDLYEDLIDRDGFKVQFNDHQKEYIKQSLHLAIEDRYQGDVTQIPMFSESMVRGIEFHANGEDDEMVLLDEKTSNGGNIYQAGDSLRYCVDFVN